MTPREKSLKKYLFCLALIFVLSFIFLAIIVSRVNPEQTSFFVFLFFYLSFFFLSLSLFSILGYVIRVFLSHNSPLNLFAAVSFRQGIFLAFLLTIVLFLQSLGALTFLGIMLLALSLTLLEVAFLTR